MKHLTQQDLYLLIKLVNQQDEAAAAVADTTEMVRRQDRDFKSLPAESLDQAGKIIAPIQDVRRRLQLIRGRLLAELKEA